MSASTAYTAFDAAALGRLFDSALTEWDALSLLGGTEEPEPAPEIEVVDAPEPEGTDENRANWLRPAERIRDWFAHEATDLTPWVAKNLNRVSQALNMEAPLTLVGTEQKIAGYRIDVLAKTQVDGQDRFVVIENQLERSDADHLGRLITCAAETKASHAIWIGVDFRPDHLRVMEALGGSMDCQFHALTLDAVTASKGNAYIHLVIPETYESPDDHMREVLHRGLRAAHLNYLTLKRVGWIRQSFPEADFTRYRELIKAMGLWSYFTDGLADDLLEEMPNSRLTGPAVVPPPRTGA